METSLRAARTFGACGENSLSWLFEASSTQCFNSHITAIHQCLVLLLFGSIGTGSPLLMQAHAMTDRHVWNARVFVTACIVRREVAIPNGGVSLGN